MLNITLFPSSGQRLEATSFSFSPLRTASKLNQEIDYTRLEWKGKAKLKQKQQFVASVPQPHPSPPKRANVKWSWCRKETDALSVIWENWSREPGTEVHSCENSWRPFDKGTEAHLDGPQQAAVAELPQILCRFVLLLMMKKRKTDCEKTRFYPFDCQNGS